MPIRNVILRAILAPAAFIGCQSPAFADEVPQCPANASPMDGWSDRAPPRKIFGNTYYVGTCGISSILIVGKHDAILIDGATDKAPAAIEANIRALGFKLSDVKRILSTHDHNDHAGGLARLQRDTGAPVLARAPAAATLHRGASDRSDPQFGQLGKFPPVANVRVIADGQTVKLGELELVAHATPGHTPGSTSWTWRSCEGTHCVDIAYVDSLTAISDKQYRYSDHPGYVAAFRHTIDTVASLRCDLLLTPHPTASDMFLRFAGTKPLIDADACLAYSRQAGKALEQRLLDEKNGKAP
ncbi:MAG: subclass B3 metallo-beta-lactamase [Proteobacteria bacterium]|nr:subclass B3 metallo-beta-lactamase [Pseudomonadota bacterium]